VHRPALILLAVILGAFTLLCGEKAHIIVSKDGSGSYRTIQEALDAVPKSNADNLIILIRKGIYREKLFIERSFVTLVGEDRDSTRIVYAELRENWARDHNNDWGSAVVNIDSLASDIMLANLTIHNNYGSLYNTPKHQFAVRGWGTRVIVLNCNIIADGNDTISLWDRVNGMYYHANCYFEGWVDYVCPRGWCYITDSKFFGHNLSASIWHDGSTDKNQKFVIRYSSFDGVPGFPLGRHHRDGAIYLLDCIFSRSMADRPIYLPNSPNSRPWIWGTRHYFFNCHREGGDYDWFKDNLADADGSPHPDSVTAGWTFDGKWDPEGTMPPVLPFVSLPRPRDGAYRIAATGTALRWVGSRNADSHLIYFGTGSDPLFRSNRGETCFDPGPLQAATTYHWHIDEIVGKDTLRGPSWHFTTK
jgi:pectinesterase